MIKDEYKNMERLDHFHWWFLGMTAIILGVLKRFYKKQGNMEILDAGSGTCWLSEPLRCFGNVSALDIEQSVSNVCRERGIKDFILGDIQKIPVEDNKFDLIVCSEVLYHIYVQSDEKAMREFFRVLKPNGRLLVKVPAHSYLSGRHDAVNLTRQRYEKEEVRKLFEKTGFKVDFISYANFFLFPAIYIKRKLEGFLPGDPSSDIKKTIAPINWFLATILRFEGFLLSKISLPQGSSIITVGRKI